MIFSAGRPLPTRVRYNSVPAANQYRDTAQGHVPERPSASLSGTIKTERLLSTISAINFLAVDIADLGAGQSAHWEVDVSFAGGDNLTFLAGEASVKVEEDLLDMIIGYDTLVLFNSLNMRQM